MFLKSLLYLKWGNIRRGTDKVCRWQCIFCHWVTFVFLLLILTVKIFFLFFSVLKLDLFVLRVVAIFIICLRFKITLPWIYIFFLIANIFEYYFLFTHFCKKWLNLYVLQPSVLLLLLFLKNRLRNVKFEVNFILMRATSVKFFIILFFREITSNFTRKLRF